MKKKKEGEDPELEEFLRALPKEPTIAERISALGRLPKRRANPVGDAQIAENKLARTMVRLNKEKTTAQAQETLQTEEDST